MATEQHTYARWLDRGARVGPGVTLAAFLAYAFGLLAPFATATSPLPAPPPPGGSGFGSSAMPIT